MAAHLLCIIPTVSAHLYHVVKNCRFMVGVIEVAWIVRQINWGEMTHHMNNDMSWRKCKANKHDANVNYKHLGAAG
jgi:hypothetical protein